MSRFTNQFHIKELNAIDQRKMLETIGKETAMDINVMDISLYGLQEDTKTKSN